MVRSEFQEALQLTKLKTDHHGVSCGEWRGYNFEPKPCQMYAVERWIWLGLQQISSLPGMQRYKGDSCCEDYNEAGGISKQSLDCELPDPGDRCRRRLR
jgi:hypothetical protein